MLRITSGRFRGRAVEKPRNRDIRPTTSLVRESVFNRLQSSITGARFLDCFAGTGLMSLEALSRGAQFALAIEKERNHWRIMHENFQNFGLVDTIANPVLKDALDVFSNPNKKEPFDIAYIDPPYGFEDMQVFVDQLIENGWMKPDGILIVEQGIRDPELAGFDHRPHGDTRISIRRLSETPA